MLNPADVDTTGALIHPSITFKAVNYVSLIPIILKGMQEQNRTIDSLRTQLQTVTDMINNCCSSNHSHGASTNPTNTSDVAMTDVKLTDV